MEQLTQAQHKAAEALYKQARRRRRRAAAGPSGAAARGAGGPTAGDEAEGRRDRRGSGGRGKGSQN